MQPSSQSTTAEARGQREVGRLFSVPECSVSDRHVMQPAFLYLSQRLAYRKREETGTIHTANRNSDNGVGLAHRTPAGAQFREEGLAAAPISMPPN